MKTAQLSGARRPRDLYMRGSALGLAVVLALGIGSATARAADPKDKVNEARRIQTQVGNIESLADHLVRTYANPQAIVRRFPNQKRLLDARVFWELGQYENAAMLLFDVLERPDFQGDYEFEPTQLLLGECLLKLDNPHGARELFTKVAQGRDRKLAEEARLYLIELALAEGYEDRLRKAVNDYTQLVSSPQAGSDRTRYGLGKAHLTLNEPDKAVAALLAIPPQSELYHRSRFYLGAAYVAKGQVDVALEVFRALTQVPGEEPLAKELRDQAWLAVGRLLVQRGAFELGLASYQNIDRNSAYYEDAVYEMSWAYINQEKYDRALQTVQVLLLTVKEGEREIDAHVLRGQLNVMMQDYDEARTSYQTIIDRFAPIRNELARFTKAPGEVQRYFKWLLDRRGGLGDLNSPLSERTLAWLESGTELARVAAVFDRISKEREEIKATQHLGEELAVMLGSKNRVEMFPDLSEGWSQALVLENRLVLLAAEMLDYQNGRIRDRLSAQDRSALAEIVAVRRSLEERAARLPTSFEAYEKRQSEIGRRYRDLEKKNFFVEQGLDEVQRQLKGIERFLNEKQYADDGKKLSPERESDLRRDIEKEKETLTAMYQELLALKRELLREIASIGTGDEATRGEDSLKASLLQAIEREGAYYDRAASRIGGPITAEFQDLGEARMKLARTIGRLDSVIAAIDREVGSKTAELVDQVRRELENLTGYEGEVTVLDGDGRVMALNMGEEFFARALGRMDQVVLEADVGLLDVMWARKNEKTQELQRLNDDRSRRIKQLQADLENIKTGANDDSDAIAPPAPPTPPPGTPAPTDNKAPEGGKDTKPESKAPPATTPTTPAAGPAKPAEGAPADPAKDPAKDPAEAPQEAP